MIFTVIYCENQGVIQVVDNFVSHRKMKHVEIHVHYMRQLVQENVVSLLQCWIDNQVTDIFTKPLPKYMFLKIWAMLGIREAAIMGCYLEQVISPLKSLESCVDALLMGGYGT